jgi:RNA polymerase sigma factor (sigma-70 family)
MSTTLSKKDQDRLVEKNMPFARKLAANLSRNLPIEAEDAVQVAYIGLIEAAQRFDPEKHDPTRSPLDQYFKSFAYQRISGSVYDEARRQTFVRRRGLEKGLRVFIDSLDATRTSDGGDELPAIDLAALAGDPDLKIDFDLAMKNLTPKEQKVIMALSYGLRGWEIAQDLGVTESRVSQIATEARRKLAEAME